MNKLTGHHQNCTLTGGPLTLLSEEETMFCENIARFADEQIRPLVNMMDQEQRMHPDIIKRLFELGLMGIAIPEEYGERWNVLRFRAGR